MVNIYIYLFIFIYIYIYLIENIFSSMTFHQFALYEGLVYGLLLIVGGLVGYSKAQSRPSLIAGSVSGILALLFSYVGLRGNDLLALFLLAAEAILLSAFFYMRYASSKKFMPSGMMLAVSVLSLIVYLAGVLVA